MKLTAINATNRVYFNHCCGLLFVFSMLLCWWINRIKSYRLGCLFTCVLSYFKKVTEALQLPRIRFAGHQGESRYMLFPTALKRACRLAPHCHLAFMSSSRGAASTDCKVFAWLTRLSIELESTFQRQALSTWPFNGLAYWKWTLLRTFTLQSKTFAGAR